MRIAIHSPANGAAALTALLAMLTRLNELFLRAAPGTPPLYESGVRYQRERRPAEDWLTIPLVMRQGHGDCEDLACWRAAELIVSGENARAAVTRPRAGLYHIVVMRADGSIEDPSRRLGM